MAKKRSRNPELVAFGTRLIELRGGRSREWVSQRLEKLGVPLGGSTIAQYEKGTVWAPDAGVLWGLSEIYRVGIDELALLLRANRANPRAAHWRELARAMQNTRLMAEQVTADDPASQLLRLFHETDADGQELILQMASAIHVAHAAKKA